LQFLVEKELNICRTLYYRAGARLPKAPAFRRRFYEDLDKLQETSGQLLPYEPRTCNFLVAREFCSGGASCVDARLFGALKQSVEWYF